MFDSGTHCLYDPRAMGPNGTIPRRVILFIGLLACFSPVSCDRPKATGQGGRRVASLVPAVTEMLIGMNLTDRLVAVSNYESAPQVSALPRVGDYQTTDWETLARVKPDAMIVQMHPDRVPAGLVQRAREMNIELVNIKIETLEDILSTMQQVAAVAGDRDRGAHAVRTLREKLDEVKESCARRKPLSVLLVRDADGKEVIGPDTFLNDLLPFINATNAAGGLKTRYPSIDPEKIAQLNPQAVIILLPGAPPETVAQALRFWNNLPQLQAVRNNRVHIITESYAHVPGPRLADLAQVMAKGLNQQPATTNKQLQP